jgi:hypothetical protein
MTNLIIAYIIVAVACRIGAHYSHGSLRKQLKTVWNAMFACAPAGIRAVAVKLGWMSSDVEK